MKTELWLPVVGYEGFYEVSNMGRVRSLSRMANHRRAGFKRVVYGKVLSLTVGKRGGYLCVKLKDVGKPMCCKIHRLVALAWIKNPNNKPEVNHIDFDKTNNTVENLEWVTMMENKKHFYDSGRAKSQKGLKGTKIIAFTKGGEKVGEYRSIREAGRELGVHGQNICAVLKGAYQQTKGYIFQKAS